MEPRFAGTRVVLVKSFARIHETNLKKQGMLALTFKDKNDYDKILENDTINVLGLESFNTSNNLKLELLHQDSSSDIFEVCHSYNNNQIDWFKAGSALNLIASKR